MKLTSYFSILLFVFALPSFADLQTNCLREDGENGPPSDVNQTCELPVIDCGDDGSNSQALRDALTTHPTIDLDDGSIESPISLQIEFTGKCIGPFVIAPVNGLALANTISLHGASSADGDPRQADRPPPMLVGNDDGSPILTILPLGQTPNLGNNKASIEKMTIRDAKGGGAIRNFWQLTVTDVVFENNTASGANSTGGAIFNTRLLEVRHSHFKNNTAETDGAAIFNSVTNVNIVDIPNVKVLIDKSSFEGNQVLTPNGGVVTQASPDFLGLRSNLIINSSSFSDSSPNLSQVVNRMGNLFITNSTLSQRGSSPQAVGLTNFDRTRITYSTIAYNAAGVVNASGVVLLQSSLITSNPPGEACCDPDDPNPDCPPANECVRLQNCCNPIVAGIFSCIQTSGFDATFHSITDLSPPNVTPNSQDPNNPFIEPTHPCGPSTSVPSQIETEFLRLGALGSYGGSSSRNPLLTVPINPGSVASYWGLEGDGENGCASTNDFTNVQGEDQRGISRPQLEPKNPGLCANNLFTFPPVICPSPFSPGDIFGEHEPSFPITGLFGIGARARAQERCAVGSYEIEVDKITFPDKDSGYFDRTYGEPPFLLLGTTRSNSSNDPNVQNVSYVSETPLICKVEDLPVEGQGDRPHIRILAASDPTAKCTIRASTENMDASIVADATEEDGFKQTPSYFGYSTHKDFNIFQASLQITGPLGTIEYGDPIPVLSPTYNGFFNGDNPANLDVRPTCIILRDPSIQIFPSLITPASPPAAGTYVTTCDPEFFSGTSASDENYRMVYHNGEFLITKAPLEIIPRSCATAETCLPGELLEEMTYGDVNPIIIDANNDTVELIIEGLKAGEDRSVLNNIECGYVDKDEGNKIKPFSSTTPAGVYQVACRADDDNYAYVQHPNCDFPDNVDNPKCAFARVKKAPLQITALPNSMVYGDAPPVISGTITDGEIKNGDQLDISCSTQATQQSPVIDFPFYSSTCTVTGEKAENYELEINTGQVEVIAAPLTIRAPNIPNAKFGTKPIVEPIYEGLKNNELTTRILPSCDTNTEPLSPVGTANDQNEPYISFCEGQDLDSNYSITFENGLVTINEGELVVVASSPTIVFSETIPEIKPTYVGLGIVDPSNISPPVCKANVLNSDNPGIYETECEGAELQHFNITYVKGTLTIVKAPTTTFLRTEPSILGPEYEIITVLLQVVSDYGVPGGTVVIRAGSGESCTAVLENGIGKCELRFETRALQTLTATYSGDTHYVGSVSKDLRLGIIQATAKTAPSGCTGVQNQNNFGLLPIIFALLGHLAILLRRRYN